MEPLTSDSEDELLGQVSTVDVESAQLLRVNGKLVEDERILSLKVSYDIEGRKLQELNYDDRGVLTRKNLSIYSQAGELEEIRSYAPDGSLVSRRVYYKDVDSNTVAELIYSGHETSNARKTVYSFSESGKVVSQTILPSIDQPSMQMQMLILYDTQDRLREVSICMSNAKDLVLVPGDAGESIMLSNELRLKGAGPCGDGLLTSRTAFSRDGAGRLLEAATYTGEGVLVSRESYAREYDSHGNWIKQILSKWKPASAEFQPIKMSYRKIVYNSIADR
jgi:hypothetical protein